MDEYVGGIATNYMTNANMLKRGLELLEWLQEDLENVGAEVYHQLMRAWELKHRALTSQCVTEHTMFREETRWPGYYYRGDHLKLDDENQTINGFETITYTNNSPDDLNYLWVQLDQNVRAKNSDSYKISTGKMRSKLNFSSEVLSPFVLSGWYFRANLR